MKWTELLDPMVFKRLCECRSLKGDIPALVAAKWVSLKKAGKDKEGFTKEDALISVLELLDCNGQDLGADLTIDEYNNLCA